MCFQIIKDGWEQGNNDDFMQKIRRCAENLETWGREITGCFSKRIKECKKALKLLRNKRDTQSVTTYENARRQLHLVLDQKEIFWKQRSKQMWLQAGNKNTKYFHATCSKRKRNNHIQRLKNENGTWVDWQSGLPEIIKNYFQLLFTTGQTHTEEVLSCINKSISDQQNIELLGPVTEEEVKLAIFNMHPDKAPGPDGMTPAFFQKNWQVIGKDVVQVIRHFFENGAIPDHINDTNIVLIPKKKHPTSISDMRPIALCNVSMKIITKVIANRLKGVLDSVISDTQSAFLPGRSITDNIMISFEIMHYLKRKKFGKEGFMALKLDMSKAYDRIEWKFLRDILTAMGFSDKWISLVMQCVSTVEYNIIHGEFEIGPIIPTRGLRQGDPLSPYLFVICAEGLAALIKCFEARKWVQGIKICKRAPVISHMLFADDTYLFCKADLNEAGKIKELLSTYEKASGQQVNINKSTIFYSANVIEYNKQLICSELQIKEADEACKYLGLPNILGRNKTVIFSYLKDRVLNSIQNWNEKNMSKPTKEILLKMVAQVLPSYAMNVFLLPLELIRDIEKSMAKFFWNSSKNQSSKIIWMSWDRLARHKQTGGLGFRYLRDFNLAMLGKQGWRLVTNPNSLVARVYKAKYYHNKEFMEASLGSSPSFIWRSILEARKVISDGAIWRVGNGKDIQILNQPWLNNKENPYVTTTSPVLVAQKVDSLFRIGTKEWDLEIIEDVFDSRDQQVILNTKIEQDLEKDVLSWKLEHSGHYFVKSAYKLMQSQKEDWNASAPVNLWKTLWKIKAPPPVLNLIWRACTSCLPTLVQLQSKHVDISTICPVCKDGIESIFHALVQCKIASACWKIFDPGINTEDNMEFPVWLETNMQGQSIKNKAKIITLCWSIWRARNDLVWKGKRGPVMRIVAKAWEFLSQWVNAQSRSIVAPITHTAAGDGAVSWVKPQTDEVKITVDATIFANRGASGMGLIARNHNGQLLLAKTKIEAEHMNPTFAEAIAIKEALSWAKEMKWHTVTVESDCQVVVQLIRSSVPMRSRLGKVVEDCRDLLRIYNNFQLYFIKQSANMSAHELAQVSHMYPDRIFDWGSVPVRVKQCIQQEI